MSKGRSLVIASVFSLLVTPAFAAKISLTGGFTGFYTPFAYGLDANAPGTVFNYVNGQQLCPHNLTGNPANDCRIDGEAYMTFAAPVPSVTYKIVVDGADWAENVVTFTPAVDQTVNGFGPSNKFLFGTLAFTNGIWADPLVQLDFNLTATSPDATLNGYDFEVSGPLIVQATVNSPGNTPEQNADYVYLRDNPGLGSVRAYELADSPTHSNTVTVQVYGYLDSLHFAEFADAQGGGFISPSTSASVVPLPGAGWLFASAAGLLTPVVRRRRPAWM